MKSKAERIAFIRKHVLRMNQTQLGAGLGVSRGAVGNWELGEPISLENVSRIAELAKCSIDWIENGTGEGPQGLQMADDDQKAVGTQGRRGMSERALPEFNLTAHGSYGGGYAMTAHVVGENGETFAADAVKDEWIVPDGWLRVEMQLTYKSTHVLPIDGPSMEPDLKQGDRVFVDLRSRDPKNEGIYVIRDGESIIVKKIQLVRPETDPPRIICKSSAPGYDPFELVLDDVQVSIIGRVAGKLTRM